MTDENLEHERRSYYIQIKAKWATHQTKQIIDYWQKNEHILHEIEGEYMTPEQIHDVRILLNEINIENENNENQYDKFWDFCLNYPIYEGKYDSNDIQKFSKSETKSKIENEIYSLHVKDSINIPLANKYKNWYVKLQNLTKHHHGSCDETGIEIGEVDDGKSLDFIGEKIRKRLVTRDSKARVTFIAGGWTNSPFDAFVITNIAQSTISELYRTRQLPENVLVVHQPSAWSSTKTFAFFLQKYVIGTKPP
eukprot:UN22855